MEKQPASPNVIEVRLDPGQPGKLASLARRRFVQARVGETAPPKMRTVSFRASRWRAWGRLLVWLGLLLRFAGGVAADWLRGKDAPQRRAVRLRRAFERAGGTFVKIGQHMAMRLDLIPWEYSVELSRMLDKVPPFPLAQAVAMVERATQRPLVATFAQFDPEPVGSTAVACVYQARLHDGQKVVVKVRRPGAGELFMADLKVLEWLLRFVEFLTILQPGYSKSIRQEFREALIEELDFVQEARYQDSFRRAAKKSGKKFFTAPRVYFDLSGEAVIVEDFVNGIWMWELLAAIEQNNKPVLELARRLNIDFKKVARRLTWINYWGWHEHLFFHANPHPDNIIVGPNSRLTFIDFGSVSAVGRTKRRALQQNMHYATKNDPLNMARATLILLEPLPSIDVLEFTKELETHNWQMVYVFAGSVRSATWQERTSALQWLGLIRTAQKYGVTIDFHVLRLIRAILLFDTLSLRLYPKLDILAEYQRFTDYHAQRVRRRVSRNVARQLSRGVNNRTFLRLEQLADTTEGLFFHLRHALALPRVNFSRYMDKWAFLVFTAVKFSGQVFLLTAVAVGLLAAGQWLTVGETAELTTLARQAVTHWGYQLLVLLLLIINWRNVLFRLDDREV
jgi:ubiquinone biosynthesis protein